MNQLPGITREDEEARLSMTIGIAEDRLSRVKASVKELADELHTMQEEFNASDKEMQQIWLNTDARFRDVSRDLYRAEQARKKPYFGRIDFRDSSLRQDEAYYIGRHAIARDPAHPEVLDWRAPIASVYYGSSLGKNTYSVKGEGKYEIDLQRKRTYEIEQDILKDFYDSDVVANDELLTKYLARNKRAVLSEIIATIQEEQNTAIRRKPQHNMIVQGAAGSGKTTVAMHRISYILYNYEQEFAPEDFYIIGSNQVLLNYITGVLPELNVYGVSQMTMEELFIRLLYEEWDPKKYSVRPVQKGVTLPLKGRTDWFRALESFCRDREWSLIPREDVRIEKTGVCLLEQKEIEAVLTASEALSRADKITRLTELLLARLENETAGKYYSYTAEEKKKLFREMQIHFGRREWKGSVFDLYQDFLQIQRDRGIAVEETDTAFDLYDLASLAYIYKRIRETEVIREAGHVVIDEAQDFGMMAYQALHYCLSKCTYTIMGDVAQNISMEYGLNDWKELRELMLPDPFDSFSLLQKSYRNTIEISGFATEILYHGEFQVYPIQPIVRHGHEVQVVGRKTEAELLKEAAETIEGWQEEGYETIAVICRDETEAGRVRRSMSGQLPVLDAESQITEFRTGVMVLPLEYVKGLEFDAVLIFNASSEAYPLTDGAVKRLYVAATRALHELKVLYADILTPLISEQVSEEQRARAVVRTEEPVKRGWVQPEEKTNAEIARELAREGARDMERRNYIGPKRIVIRPEEKKSGETGITEKPMQDQNLSVRRSRADRQTEEKTWTATESKNKTGVRQKEYIDERNLLPGSEFGSTPEQGELRPEGHSRIDCSVRLCMKGKGYYDIVSSYGTLRVMPMAEERVRICFSRTAQFPNPDKELLQSGFRFKSRETKTGIDLVTEKMWVKIDKKTGAVAFCHADGKPFLTERAREPRQMGTKRNYVFFDWGKKEKLEARGITDSSYLRIGQIAKYISFGKKRDRMSILASDQGYRILVPSGWKTMCCNLSAYGPYLSMESGKLLEYYVEIAEEKAE